MLGVATAAGWTLLQPKVYTADASGYVSSASNGDTSSALIGDNLARAKVTSYLDIGSWRSVAEHAIDELGLRTTPEALVQRVEVSNPLDTVVIKVVASASSPEDARDLAEAWIRGMVVEINTLEGSSDGSGVVTLSVGDSARLPSSPSSPNTRLALALGGLIGLVIGVGYALLRHTLDRRIRSAEGVEKETGVPVVGTIPLERSFTDESRLIPFDDGNAQAGGRAPDVFAIAEAMRELRTNLQFMDVDNPPRVIVVTSPLPGDGKSTTSANLAITLAANDQRVVLIDGDLRRPTIASIFHLVTGAGLTDVLAGRAELAEVLQPAGPSGNLLVLEAGQVPPNPSEVLGSERMRVLLETLSEQAIVIIDAPPLIPVTDATVLATRADGAFVVASAGKTTYEVLDKALQNLRRANARTLGVVLNRVPRSGSAAASYGYQYRGDYYRSASAKAAAGVPVAGVPVAGAPAAAGMPASIPLDDDDQPRGRRARRV